MTATLADGFLESEEYLLDPAPFWARLREEQPLLHDERGGFWLLSRYDDVVAVLRDHETYATLPYRRVFRPVIGPTFVEMDGEEHDVRRAIVAPQLVGRPLQSYRPLIDRSVERLLARLPEGRVDLQERVTSRLPLLVIAEILGLPEDDHEFFYTRCAHILKGLAGVEPALSEGIRAHRELAEHFRPQIEARTTEPGPDLISRIARAEAEGYRPTSDEIASLISLLLVAGGETTDMGIANLWWSLLTEREALEQVAADPSLLDNAFSESLRRDCAVVYEDRETTREVEWHGRTIPAGATVRVCLGAANHDETAFANPDAFDLHRRDLRLAKEMRSGGRTADGVANHLTFGAGKHFCVGYQLARAEALSATERLLERMRNPRFAPDAPSRLRIFWFHRHPDRLVVEYDAR